MGETKPPCPKGRGRMKKTRKESRTADREALAVGYSRVDRFLLNDCKCKKNYCRMQVGLW